MKHHCLLVVFLGVVSHVLAQSMGTTNITAINSFGIDMIRLDAPGWVTHLQRSHEEHQILAFGETTLRTIAVGGTATSQFVATPVNPWSYSMLDLHTFYQPNTTFQWTIGVSGFNVDNGGMFSSQLGPYLPFVLINPAQQATVAPSNDPSSNLLYDGLTYSAVRVDARNLSDVHAYYAGFASFTGNANNDLSTMFSVLRTHVDTTSATPFFYASTRDFAEIYPNQYTSFSSAYKPWVHIMENFGPQNITLVVVADPNSRYVYMLGNDNTGQLVLSNDVPINMKGYNMVSTAIDNVNGTLYVGMAAPGMGTGAIVTIQLALNVQSVSGIYYLPTNCSNPKAIALDQGSRDVLYIGLNGDSEVLRFDLNINNVTGYQRLPEWLHRTWTGLAGRDHIYFATYEQHAKVFRVAKTDFCPSRCPYWGYCSNGACTCGQGFTLSKDGSTCDWETYEKVVHEEHVRKTGEIVLGLFFMFSTIAAAAGWFMWYRTRRGSYQAV